MAYVANDDEEEQTQPGGVSPSGGGGGVHLAPSSAVGAVGTGAGTSGNGQGTGGGSFATINQYLNANQGEAAPLAGQITAGITNQYNTLQGQNSQVASDLNNQVNSGYTAEDQGLLGQEAADPTNFAANAANVTGFQGQLNDKYTGPQSAETNNEFTGQQSNLNTAIANGQAATQTEAGREGLLAGTEKTPTQGVTALNSAILSQDPNATNSIETAYQPFQNLVSGLNSTGQQVDQNIAGAQGQAQQASTDANNQIQSQVTGLNNTVGGENTALTNQFNGYNSAVGTVQTAANTANSGIQNYLNTTPQVTADTSALNPYLNLAPLTGAAPTDATSATSQDYALQNALQTLNGATPLNTDITQATAGQAGTALPQNFQSLVSQLGGLPTAVQNTVGGIGNQINAAYAPLGTVEAQREGMWADQAKQPALNAAVTADQKALAAIPDYSAVNSAKGVPLATVQKDDAARTAAQQKLAADTAAANSNQTAGNAGGTALGQQAYNLAQGDQWIPGAATGYNSLLTTLNQGLAPIGNIDMAGIEGPQSSSQGFMPSTPQGEKEAGGIGQGIGTIAGGVLGAIYGGPAGAGGGAAIGGELGKPAGEGAYNSISQLSSDISNPKLDTTGLDIATGGISIGLEQGIKAIGDFFKNLF